MEFMRKEVIWRMMFKLWICIHLKVLSHSDLIDILEGCMRKSFQSKLHDGLLERHVDGVHEEGDVGAAKK